MYEIRLHEPLRQNDIIRVDHNNEDVNLSVVKLYDRAGNLINRADEVCCIRVKEKLSKGDLVYKTKDYQFYKDLERNMEGEFRRFPLLLRVYAYPGAPLTIDAEGLGVSCLYESEEILEAAETQPTTGEQVRKQLAKLHDTVFTLQSLEFEECGAFLPVKLLNQARREIVNRLYEEKLRAKPRRVAVRETAVQTEETGIRNTAAADTQTAEAVCPKENLRIAAGSPARESCSRGKSAGRRDGRGSAEAVSDRFGSQPRAGGGLPARRNP